LNTFQILSHDGGPHLREIAIWSDWGHSGRYPANRKVLEASIIACGV
jgi:hypothetical protein